MLRCALGCAALLAAGVAPAAEVYPAKLVRIVVPFAAGGSTDLLARHVGQQLNTLWKQPVVVENRAGGGGVIGSELVMKSAPDGYTLLVGTVSTHAAAATLYRKLPFDVQRDFAPITEFALIPQLLSVHPSVPVYGVKELVALAKQRPGELNFASAGNGSASHMAMELLLSMSKSRMSHVPYKGSGPALQELLGGHVSLMFDVVMTTLAHRQSGKLRTLGVSSLKRSSVVPDVPTIAELGYPGFEAIVWFGLFAPAATPADIVRRINEDSARVLNAPKMREVLASQGLEVIASSPAEFARRVASEVAKWRKVITDAGIKLE